MKKRSQLPIEPKQKQVNIIRHDISLDDNNAPSEIDKLPEQQIVSSASVVTEIPHPTNVKEAATQLEPVSNVQKKQVVQPTPSLLNPSTIIDAQLRQYKIRPKNRYRQRFDLGTALIYILGFFFLLGLTLTFWPRADVFAPPMQKVDEESELALNRQAIKVTSSLEQKKDVELTVINTTEVRSSINLDVHGHIYYGQVIGPKFQKHTASDLRLPRLAPLAFSANNTYSQKYIEWGINHSKQNESNERLPIVDDTYINDIATFNILFDLNKTTLQEISNRHAAYLAKIKEEALKQKKDSTVTNPTVANAANKSIKLSAAQKASAKYRSNKVIYITYDFPKNEYINARSILNVLDLYQTNVTFFISGDLLTESPELVLRMNKSNHAIGSLGWNANDVARLSVRNEKVFREQIDKLDKHFTLLTGRPLDSFYRPCEGSFSEQALYIIRSAGYYPTFWSLEMHNFWPDSKNTLNYRFDNLRKRDFNINPYPYTVDQALNLIMQELHDGMILRLDGRSKVDVALLEPLIKNLHTKGYSCLTLNEIPLEVMQQS